MTLSCLSHVKRVLDEDGNILRPQVPALIVILELIVDRSYSMRNLGSAPTQGTLHFINEQKMIAQKTGAEIYFSLTSFDDNATTYIDNVRIETVNPTRQDMANMIQPRGCTKLVDTVYARLCAMRTKIKTIVKSLPREIRELKPKMAIVVAVITDGEDNRSVTFSDAQLNTLIAKKRAEGFTILFLAANQDAIQTAQKWGIAPDCAQTFGATPMKTHACFKSASAATARAVSGQVPSFTKRERQSTAPVRQRVRGSGINVFAHLSPATPTSGLSRAVSCVPHRASMCRQNTVAAYT